MPKSTYKRVQKGASFQEATSQAIEDAVQPSQLLENGLKGMVKLEVDLAK